MLAERRGTLEPVLEVEGHGRAAFVLVANCDPYTYARPSRFSRAGRALRTRSRLPRRAAIDTARAAALLLTSSAHGQEHADDVLYRHDLDRIEVVCDQPLPLQVDGEDLGDVEQVVFEAEPAPSPCWPNFRPAGVR